MGNEAKRKKTATGVIFSVFIIVNILLLTVSIYTLFFSSSSPFTEHRMSHDTLFWIGAFKNIALLSGLWIFIDVIFSIFFYLKTKIH
jgi:hypothetical protein